MVVGQNLNREITKFQDMLKMSYHTSLSGVWSNNGWATWATLVAKPSLSNCQAIAATNAATSSIKTSQSRN